MAIFHCLKRHVWFTSVKSAAKIQALTCKCGRPALPRRCADAAEDGRYKLLKISVKYEGDLGRQKKHDFPKVANLPA